MGLHPEFTFAPTSLLLLRSSKGVSSASICTTSTLSQRKHYIILVHQFFSSDSSSIPLLFLCILPRLMFLFATGCLLGYSWLRLVWAGEARVSWTRSQEEICTLCGVTLQYVAGISAHDWVWLKRFTQGLLLMVLFWLETFVLTPRCDSSIV